MAAAWAVPAAGLRALTPAPLRVVELWPGWAPLAIGGFDYARTTVGAYGEVGVSWPVVPHRAPPLLPLLGESRWPGMGWWVHHLPVTTEIAHRAGRSLWGYPKIVAGIDFDWDGAERTCRLHEEGREILRLSIDTRMSARPRRFALHTYSVLGEDLVRTCIDVDAVGRRRTVGGKAHLSLGEHPMGRELAALGLPRARLIEVRWFPTWRAVLPAGEHRPR